MAGIQGDDTPAKIEGEESCPRTPEAKALAVKADAGRNRRFFIMMGMNDNQGYSKGITGIVLIIGMVMGFSCDRLVAEPKRISWWCWWSLGSAPTQCG